MEAQDLTLVNPATGNFVFKIYSFEDCSFTDLQRSNCYLLILVNKGNGKVKTNFTEYSFVENSLFAFSPYQPFVFNIEEKVSGTVLQFHPDFYCIYMHQKEVACNGVLFNNIYDPPLTKISTPDVTVFDMLLGQMKKEVNTPALAQHDLLVSYLKIFLITATRIKNEQDYKAPVTTATNEPLVLQSLKDAIEENYKTKHAPADYAEMLKIPLKSGTNGETIF